MHVVDWIALNARHILLPGKMMMSSGQQWASNQKRDDLLSRFEEFYKDWTNDQLTNKRYKMLYEELAPASVIAEMSDTINQALVDPHVAAAMLENFHLFEKGIVWGLMSAIKKIITGIKTT